MKKIFLILLILVKIPGFYFHNSASLFAQDIFAGIKGGINTPYLRGGNSEESKGFKSRVAPTIGIMSSIEFKNQFALQLEVSYMGQGGVKSGIQSIDSGIINYPGLPSGTLYADYQNSIILNYIEIPLLLKYSFTIEKQFNLFFDAGPNIGFLLGAKNKTSGTSQIYIDKEGTPLTDANGNIVSSHDFTSSTKITDEFNTINFSITGGIGVSNEFSSGELSLEFRGEFGFTDLQKDPLNGNNRTGCLIVVLGYRINAYSVKRRL
jgi:hypothetical protein